MIIQIHIHTPANNDATNPPRHHRECTDSASTPMASVLVHRFSITGIVLPLHHWQQQYGTTTPMSVINVRKLFQYPSLHLLLLLVRFACVEMFMESTPTYTSVMCAVVSSVDELIPVSIAITLVPIVAVVAVVVMVAVVVQPLAGLDSTDQASCIGFRFWGLLSVVPSLAEFLLTPILIGIVAKHTTVATVVTIVEDVSFRFS